MKEKRDMILKIVGWALCGIMLVAGIIFVAKIIKFNAVPNKYIVMLSIIIVIFTAIFAVLQKWFVPGIIGKVLAFILAVLMFFGSHYVTITRKTIDKIAGNKVKIDNICVYVLNNDPAQSLSQMRDYTYGILEELDRENTDKFIDNINEELETTIGTKEYTNILTLIEGLRDGETGAIILNSAFLAALTDLEGYGNIEKELRIVKNIEIKTEIHVDKDRDDSNQSSVINSNDDVVTIYISGIDTTGNPTENRNSDVNIIMALNKKTRQILLVSTPRDFYMPLSVSGGAYDKLTHAGCKGVDCSVDTLEMFYGYNIDYYLKVNFTGFVKIIDLLGGVDVHSDQAFSSAISSYTYVEGNNHLSGEAALYFARERHAFAGGDRMRGTNQMKIINAIIAKMTSTDVLKNYSSLLDALADCMVTSMPSDELTGLIKFQLDDMRGWDVIQYSVNGAGDTRDCWSLPAPNYVMIPDMATVELAKEYFGKIYNSEKIEH